MQDLHLGITQFIFQLKIEQLSYSPFQNSNRIDKCSIWPDALVPKKLNIIFWGVRKKISHYLPCLRQSAHCNVAKSHNNGKKRM